MKENFQNIIFFGKYFLIQEQYLYIGKLLLYYSTINTDPFDKKHYDIIFSRQSTLVKIFPTKKKKRIGTHSTRKIDRDESAKVRLLINYPPIYICLRHFQKVPYVFIFQQWSVGTLTN